MISTLKPTVVLQDGAVDPCFILDKVVVLPAPSSPRMRVLTSRLLVFRKEPRKKYRNVCFTEVWNHAPKIVPAVKMPNAPATKETVFIGWNKV